MKQYEFKEISGYMAVSSDYKCGAWKFRDQIIELLNRYGQEGWKPVILDNIEDSIYYDSTHNICDATFSGIFVREIEQEDNITLNKN